MTERPIIFSGPMVRAVLEGRKTQTRRIIKPQPNFVGGPFYRPFPSTSPMEWHSVSRRGYITNIQKVRFCIGDLLWVRESLHRNPDLWCYAADGTQVGWPGRRDLAARKRDYLPSIHMPRDCSRLTLSVISVRVERLQSITDDDAVQEGCLGCLGPNPDFPDEWDPSPAEEFHQLWDSINAKRAPWASNPWVVAITFDVIKANIDALKEAA